METKKTGRLPGWLRHAWHWLACILLLAVCITALQRTMQDNYTGQWQVNGFLAQPKNSLDVVFFGSSNMYRTVRPQQLLEEVSYRALPSALVEKVEVDVGDLKVGDSIKVRDLSIASDKDIDLMTDLDAVVATVSAVHNNVPESETEEGVSAE